MPTMHVTQFDSLESARRRPITPHSITGKQLMAPTSTSQQSNPYSGNTAVVSIICDRAVYLARGSDSTATTADSLAPGVELVWGAAPGEKLAVILA
jgi:hypothetical protein